MLLDVYLRRPRGLFFLSNHPWIAVVVLLVVIGVVLYLRNRDR